MSMMNSIHSPRRQFNSKKKRVQRSRWFSLLVIFFFLLVVTSLSLISFNLSQLENNNQNIMVHSKAKSAHDFLLSNQTKYHHPDSNKMRELAQCNDDQMMVISRQLEFNTCNFTSQCGGMFGKCCGIIRETRCPQSSWLHDYYREDYRLREDNDVFVGLSIGCNKGFDAINTARMGMNSPKFDKMLYIDTLKKKLPHIDGGACSQMHDLQFDLLPNEPPRSGEMHCVEPMPSTSNALSSTTTALGLDQGLDQFRVFKAAISSSNGIVKFPSPDSPLGLFGLEIARVDTCDEKPETCKDVPMFSLQTYVKKFVKSAGPINILSIDVEGLDFDVLFGAGDVLDRTEYIEFEYHVVGHWFNYHLMDAVRLLDGKGFTCYWAGKEKLWRITGCYHDYYNTFKGWSNVVCAHRSQHKLATKMETLFLKTLRA